MNNIGELETNLLTVFYSRTGTTRKVAEAISKALSCDIEEIVDTKDRGGVLGHFTSSKDAIMKKLTRIQKIKRDPALYDIVLIGTPVWAGTMSAPIRTYISQNKEHFRRVALFCTYGGTGVDKTLEAMKDLCGKLPIASVAIRTKEIESEEHLQKIDEFVNTIKRTSQL